MPIGKTYVFLDALEPLSILLDTVDMIEIETAKNKIGVCCKN